MFVLAVTSLQSAILFLLHPRLLLHYLHHLEETNRTEVVQSYVQVGGCWEGP